MSSIVEKTTASERIARNEIAIVRTVIPGGFDRSTVIVERNIFLVVRSIVQ